MKKLLRNLLMTVMALCLSLPCLSVEAATVALLPLVNNVQGDEVANQVFYKEAIATMNAQKGFMMVENDKVTSAIKAINVVGSVPSEVAAAQIAKGGDVDIVIAIQLDKIEEETIFSSEENRVKVLVKGKSVSYNSLTGTYRENKIHHEVSVPEAFTSRWDVPHEEWGKVVRKEIKKALAVKK